jgi:hypothetical protein
MIALVAASSADRSSSLPSAAIEAYAAIRVGDVKHRFELIPISRNPHQRNHRVKMLRQCRMPYIIRKPLMVF